MRTARKWTRDPSPPRIELLGADDIAAMPYVRFVALLNETNRPPGGKHSIRWIATNSQLSRGDLVLEIGCNTGFSSIELAAISGCRVIGIDPSGDAIRTAKGNARSARLSRLATFRRADGRRLPFKSGSFDLVMCGGALAWISDRGEALEECRRVMKPWGMLAAVSLHYHTPPPARLLRRLNEALQIEIRPWQAGDWRKMLQSSGLELYHQEEFAISSVPRHEVASYVRELTRPHERAAPPKTLAVIRAKAEGYFSLFNENHRYLSYSIFLLRHRPVAEQRTLF